MIEESLYLSPETVKNYFCYRSDDRFYVIQAQSTCGAIKLVIKRRLDNKVFVAYCQQDYRATFKPAKIIEYG